MRKGLLLLSLVFPLAMGCGGAPPAKVASASAAPGTESATGAEFRPALTAVAAPKDVIAVMRISSLGSLADTLGLWSNVPLDWRSLLRDTVGNVDGVVMFDAPVDAVAALDASSHSMPRVLYAVSIGISSVERARELFTSRDQAMERAADGSYDVEIGGNHCRLAAALGKAPARLVCADKQQALDQLSAYMTRGLPGESVSASALYVEMRAEPWRRLFGNKLQMIKLGVPFALRELEFDHPQFDSALSDTLYAVADEVIALANDLDVVILEGKLDDRASSLDFSMSVKLRDHKSWFSQWLTEAEGKMGPPPESFWLMPSDADEASYQVASGGKSQQLVRAGIVNLVKGGLSYLGVPARLQTDTVHALDDFLQHPSAGSSAGGSVRRASQVAGSAQAAPAEYHLFTFDDQGRADQLLKQLVLVYRHPATRKTLQAKISSLEWADLSSRKPAAGSGLPAASTVYELTVPAKWHRLFHPAATLHDEEPAASGARKFFIVATIVGDRTWLGVSNDESLVSQKLTSALGSGASGSLRQNTQISRLGQQRSLAAGFVTLRAWLASFSDLIPVQPTALEHSGTTPMFHHWDISSGGTVMTVGLSVPKPVFADLAQLVMSIVAQDSGLGLQ